MVPLFDKSSREDFTGTDDSGGRQSYLSREISSHFSSKVIDRVKHLNPLKVDEQTDEQIEAKI
jgi:hypothetical protein